MTVAALALAVTLAQATAEDMRPTIEDPPAVLRVGADGCVQCCPAGQAWPARKECSERDAWLDALCLLLGIVAGAAAVAAGRRYR